MTLHYTIATTLLVIAISGLLVACGEHQGAGEVTSKRLPEALVTDKQQRQLQAVKAFEENESPKQILFGDLHVHTTFSPDAFITAMPLMGGEGAHPPADACDFARYCSALDFWSINDHAEGVTPRRWQETRESIRQCNAVAGDPDNPDTVAFLGWEWSQVNTDPDKHYGHKNVIFRDMEEGKVPTRSIAAPRDQLGESPIKRFVPLLLAAKDRANKSFYLNINRYYDELAETPPCEKGDCS